MKSPEKDDIVWMSRALALAQRGEGLTRPNPPVGAIIVKKGRMVGEGYHRKAGGPHAEIHALKQAGENARDGTLYVTLEPCSTWGRTPPCTDAILQAGLSRVVVAMTDPNPLHAGRGLRLLRKRGVEVTCDVCRQEASEILAPFAKWVSKGQPWITLKLAASLDGRIADGDGCSKWITGRIARRVVHAWRRRVDAVMVGAGTVARDDPDLTPRPSRGREPFRVIVDSVRAHAPLAARVFTDQHASRTILAVPQAYPARRRRILESRGVRVLVLPGEGGRVDLRKLVLELGRIGLLHVLCEGGGELAGSLVKSGLVDTFLFLYAPLLLGDGRAVRMLGSAGWPLYRAVTADIIRVELVGKDLMVVAKPLRR